MLKFEKKIRRQKVKRHYVFEGNSFIQLQDRKVLLYSKDAGSRCLPQTVTQPHTSALQHIVEHNNQHSYSQGMQDSHT